MSVSGAARLVFRAEDGGAMGSFFTAAALGKTGERGCSGFGIVGVEGFLADGVRKKLATCIGFPCCMVGGSGEGSSTKDWHAESIWELILVSLTALPQIGQSTIVFC